LIDNNCQYKQRIFLFQTSFWRRFRRQFLLKKHRITKIWPTNNQNTSFYRFMIWVWLISVVSLCLRCQFFYFSSFDAIFEVNLSQFWLNTPKITIIWTICDCNTIFLGLWHWFNFFQWLIGAYDTNFLILTPSKDILNVKSTNFDVKQLKLPLYKL